MIATFRELLPEGAGLPELAWRRRHRAILGVLWLHVIVVPIFGMVRGFNATHLGLETAAIAVPAVLASWAGVRRRVRTAAASVGLLSSSAVLVHLSGGVIEMHFHFFVMVAVVALYQDWLPFLAAIAYVFVHHGLVGALDAASVYNHAAAQEDPWTWAGIHALFITGISVACLVNWRVNEAHSADRMHAEDRVRQLAEASKVLTSSLELDMVMGRLAELVASSMADRCVIDLVGEDGALVRVADASEPRATPRAADVLGEVAPSRADMASPIAQAVATGATQVVDVADRVVLAMPLVGRQAVLGAMTIVTRPGERAHISVRERGFGEDLARRAAVAVENAQLFARQRSVADTLQRSLLPDRLIQLPGLASAARYVAGGAGVDIGGDWYDVVQLQGGRVGVAMGDVVGRGERAASLMGQLRNAVRAYATIGKGPRDVLESVNALMFATGVDQMATMVYGELDVETGSLRFATAGHPPPLIRGAHGEVGYVDVESGVPLGVSPRGGFTEVTTTLEPGATIVLYTDGLVEDREHSLDVGLGRLKSAVAAGPADLDALCGHVINATLGGDSAPDDAAVLVVQLLPLGDRLDLRLPADPGVLPPLRALLRRWLSDSGASQQETYEILVAATEACTNAIRHANGMRDSVFIVHLERDDEIRIRVTDTGAWREPRGEVGGRGLAIIEDFVDEVDVLRGADGTEVRMRRRLAAGGVRA